MFVYDNPCTVSSMYQNNSSYSRLISVTVEVGGESRIIVALSTGRNAVSKAMLRLTAASGIQFNTETIKIEGEGMSPKEEHPFLCLLFRRGSLLRSCRGVYCLI